MAELDALLLGGPTRGWVLVKGGPGMGKSALLAEWLKRREDAGLPVPPHHFLRRGVEDWDRPEVVKRNLAAQVEKLYPELADPGARSESRLRELLQRVSDKVLKPRNERLVLVVDGLDEVEGESDGSNPLKRFLPNALPQGVKVLCASRPTYPYLSWLEGLEAVRPIDLDGERWAGSNKEVVRQYWEQAAPRFVPPLTPVFLDEVVQRAEGNVLYAVKLAEWLQEQPVEKRRAELLPRGLEALLEESWERIQGLPGEFRKVVLEGLGVVAVAREALSLSVLAAVVGWEGVENGERFLRVARSFLLEELGHANREKHWRPFHESFRSFILAKLGEERERAEHQRVARQLCRWPVDASDGGFRWSYVLRHGVTHWLKAREWDEARRLFTDLGYLESKCQVAGVVAVEEDLRNAADGCRGSDSECPKALHQAIQAESHGLRRESKALALLVYNRLRCLGWPAARIEKTLRFPEGLPALRLKHPVKTGGSVRTLEEHRGPVMGCAVTPDGQRVVSASWDKTLKVWEVETGQVVVTLEGHEGGVSGCAVTPDGRRVVSASEDGTLKIWEVETGRELATLKGHQGGVSGCAVTPDGQRVISASADGTLKVWDAKTGRELATLKGHEGGVSGCAVTPDGQRVVSASWDKTLKIWDVETGRELATFKGHGDWVKGCAVMPDGRRVVSSSDDKLLKVWDVETRRVLATLEGHGDWVKSCAVMLDGRRVVSSSEDGTLKVWDVETGGGLSTLKEHEGGVSGCAITPDGRRVVSAYEDGKLKVWDVETGCELVTLKGHTGRVIGCVMTPDGQRVVSASEDGALKIWKVKTRRVLSTVDDNWGRMNCCAMTPDGRRVVSGFSDGVLVVWDAERRCVLAWLKGHKRGVKACAVTSDGRRVMSTSNDGMLKVWDVETGRELVTLMNLGGGVRGCAMMPDGQRVVLASEDKTLKVCELETGRVQVVLEGHADRVNGCVVMSDGGVVSASDDKTLKVWDVDSGRCHHTLYGGSAFLSVASTPDAICAGDVVGNVWILEVKSSVPKVGQAFTRALSSVPNMSIPFPKPLLEAHRSNTLALFIGSGLSLGRDVRGDFPTWQQLPQRLLDACERLGSIDEQVIHGWRNLFKGCMSLELMLAQLGSLRAALGHEYPKALDAIFRPSDAAPGSVHQALARLGVRAILTTNYDPLIEEVGETPRRQVYTWRDSDKALRDLDSGRKVLLKVHGTAEHHDTVVMTELEYHKARSEASYQRILSHLLQGYTFLFIGYGMNDPLDLDLVLKWNAEAFKSAARRHYAFLKDPSDNDRDRYEREYNVRVIPYSDHAQLPAILEELQRAASNQATH